MRCTVLLLVLALTGAEAQSFSIAPYANLGYEEGGYVLETDSVSPFEVADFAGIAISGGARGSVQFGRLAAHLQLDLANLDQIVSDTPTLGGSALLTAGWRLGAFELEAGGHYLRGLNRVSGYPADYSLTGVLLRVSADLAGASGAFILEPRFRTGRLSEYELLTGLQLSYRFKFIQSSVGLGCVLRNHYVQTGTIWPNRLRTPLILSLGIGYAPLGTASDFLSRCSMPKRLAWHSE
jgi:hypothetical protein